MDGMMPQCHSATVSVSTLVRAQKKQRHQSTQKLHLVDCLQQLWLPPAAVLENLKAMSPYLVIATR